jgi:carbon starvation protein CstA
MQAANAGATGTVIAVCKDILGPVGGVIALAGIVVLPITSGDTALRGLRLTVAEALNIDQSTNSKRLTLSGIIFALVACILVFAKLNTQGFNILWRYFAWSNQTLSLFAFLAISIWMFENGKKKFVWIPLIPGGFYAFITITYIMNAKIGFNLPWGAAYVVGVVAALAYIAVIIWWGNKRTAKTLK